MLWKIALSLIAMQRDTEHAYRMARMMHAFGNTIAALFWQEEAARQAARMRQRLFENI
jgi:hypothetical protein